MFYLKEFFTTLWDLKGRGLLFLLASFMLALVCVFRPSVDATVAALAPDAWARPYFTALFDSSVPRADVLEDISRRPEVAEVQVLNQTETTGILGRLIASIGSDYQGKAAEVAAFGLRVVLKNAKLSVEGEELLNGLEESYGKEHVTTSGVRTPKVGGLFQSHPLFRYLARFGYLGILVPVALVWVLAFTLCFGHFSRRAWIVERFQRRELVRAKTMAAGLAAAWAVCALFSIVLQGPDVIGLGLGVALFSIPWASTMREAQWRAPR